MYFYIINATAKMFNPHNLFFWTLEDFKFELSL